MEANPPKSFTLRGKEYACYQAGTKFGGNSAYQTAAETLRQVKNHQGAQLVALRDQLLDGLPDNHPLRENITALPTLAEYLEGTAAQFSRKAGELQTEGSQFMGNVAAHNTADKARWRPPLRAWLMLVGAMTVITTLSTLLVFAFLQG